MKVILILAMLFASTTGIAAEANVCREDYIYDFFYTAPQWSSPICSNNLFAIAGTTGIAAAPNPSSKDYDFFYMVMLWPRSYCNSPDIACQRTPLPDYFTIHGLWPEKKGAYSPENCGLPKFDYNKLNKVVSDLNKYWLDLKDKSWNAKFWEYEWNKHGTCSADDLPIEKYFEVAVNFAKRYNIKTALETYKPAIKPGGKPKIDDIWRAIYTNFGFRPVIECNIDKNGTLQLYQIRFCLSKNENPTPIDCDSNSRRCGENPKEKQILYPLASVKG